MICDPKVNTVLLKERECVPIHCCICYSFCQNICKAFKEFLIHCKNTNKDSGSDKDSGSEPLMIGHLS